MNQAGHDIETQVTSRVALDAADWAIATWRPRQVVVAPKPPKFDRQDRLTRLRRLLAGQAMYSQVDWSRAGLGPAVSPAEAHFWLAAMTETSRDARFQSALAVLERVALTGTMSREEIRTRLRQRAGYITPVVLIPLCALLSPDDLLDLLLDAELSVIDPQQMPHYQIASLQDALVEGFRRHALPHLDDATLERLRQRARSRLPPSLWTQSAPPAVEQKLGYRLAAVLGLHRELAALVATWPDDLFSQRHSFEDWRRLPREILFGLGDPWLVEQHMRRLKLLPRTGQDARAWLAHTEAQALDVLRDGILASGGALTAHLLGVLCLVESPAAARPLLELRLAGRSSPEVKRWFERMPGNAVAGLLPLAAGRGRLADAARQVLREVGRRGHADVLEAQLANADAAVATRIRNTILDVADVEYPCFDKESTPIWLRQALLTVPAEAKSDGPDWLSPDDLPPLVVGGRCLNSDQVQAALRALASAKILSAPPLLAALRTHTEAPSREAFAWRLVEQWRRAGSLDRDIWALNAPGLLGEDESALKLAALVREQKGHQGRLRAVQALHGLAAIGNSMALLQLTALSRQASSRLVREQARELVERTAKTRGQSRGEFEDVTVPTLGFQGERGPSFDFGPRQFQAMLATGPRLLLRDSAGNVRADLPAPGARDDNALAKKATADWRLLKKAVRDVFKEQSARFERAMVSGHRWSPRHFRERVLGQPLLHQLARLVLWGGYDERGRLARTFRLNEEKAFVDEQERPVAVADFNSVRIVHPIELPEPALQAWTAVWRDHELVAPFAQLGRRLYPMREQDRMQAVVTAFRGRRVPALTIAGLVKSRDWQPTAIGHARLGEAHVKEFRLWATTAVLHHPNVGPHVYPYHQAVQELRGAYFFRGPLIEDEPIDIELAVRLGEVNDLVRSEVCELMALLFGKGKE